MNETKPKSRHGGPRPGSGRPSNEALAAKRDIAARVLEKVDEEKLWTELLTSSRDNVRLDAAKYLSDRLYGKAAQPVEISSPSTDFARLALWLQRADKLNVNDGESVN